MDRRSQQPPEGANTRFHRVVFDGFKDADIPRFLRQDVKELYRFYLSEDERARLEAMGPVRRFFRRWLWLFKNILLRLSPVRRLLLLLALLLAFSPFAFTAGRLRFEGGGRLAFLILLLVLMLELKDKLLARDEIEVARHVQLSLLPAEQPSVAGWRVWGTTRPANDVGGDLVDYLDLGAGRVGIALGDVAGKGMGAALLTAKLQATLRALAPRCPSLGELGSRINAVFCDDGLDNRYATLFYCEIEPRSPRLRFLNAGHNPPVLLRPAGSETLEASSYPLGMWTSADYSEGATLMDAGALLIVYSDGLTEARDAAGREFGEPRLRELLGSCRDRSPEEIGRRILDEVDSHVGDARLHDDLSLVVIRAGA